MGSCTLRSWCKSFGNCVVPRLFVLVLRKFLKVASSEIDSTDRWADFPGFSSSYQEKEEEEEEEEEELSTVVDEDTAAVRHCLRRWHDLFHDRRLIHWRESCHRQSHAHLCLRRW